MTTKDINIALLLDSKDYGGIKTYFAKKPL